MEKQINFERRVRGEIMKSVGGNSVLTANNRSPTCRRPSCSAAPPSIILVTKIPWSLGMCSLPMPPAILKPKPVTFIHKYNNNTVITHSIMSKSDFGKFFRHTRKLWLEIRILKLHRKFLNSALTRKSFNLKRYPVISCKLCLTN